MSLRISALFFVVHQELAVLEVLALLFALGGHEIAAHPQARELPVAAEPSANALGMFFAERLDDFVVERDEKLSLARVALAGAAAGKLAVDAAGFVPFGADDVETADLGDAVSQLDVGAATGHVGRDSDASGLASLRDDLSLDLMVLGV